MVKRAVVVLAAALLLPAAGGATATRAIEVRAGDQLFVRDAGVRCVDQRLTALRATQKYVRTLGQYGISCFPRGGLRRGYVVRVSDLGVVVERNGRIVFGRRNG